MKAELQRQRPLSMGQGTLLNILISLVDIMRSGPCGLFVPINGITNGTWGALNKQLLLLL